MSSLHTRCGYLLVYLLEKQKVMCRCIYRRAFHYC